MFKQLASLTVIAGTFFCTVGQAATVTGSVEIDGLMSHDFNYNEVSSTALAIDDNNTFEFMGSELATMSNPGMGGALMNVWQYDWKITANSNPYIDAVFSITNLTSSTQTFNVFFSLPVTTPFAPGFKFGDLSLTFTDTGGAPGVSASINSWTGLIDGSPALSLFTTTPIPCTGAGCSGMIFPVSTGPVFESGGVSSSIGLQLSFDLSAGDTMDIDTRFQVTPVPLPGAAWLFGAGLLGLVGFRKKTV